MGCGVLYNGDVIFSCSKGKIMSKEVAEKKKSVHAGHRGRLREQFLNNGDALLEHQLLELMLSFVIPQKDTNPIAHDLINTFGSIADVVDAPMEELTQIKGISEVVATFLHFESKFIDIYRRSRANNKPVLYNVDDIVEYLKQTVTITNVEQFYYLCLDTKNKLICFREMGVGTAHGVTLDNKKFMASVLAYKAHSVVICHTHPCGTPNPSDQDIKLTNMIDSLLKNMSITLLDHIIISHDGFFSFYRSNILGKQQRKEMSDLDAMVKKDLEDIYDIFKPKV